MWVAVTPSDLKPTTLARTGLQTGIFRSLNSDFAAIIESRSKPSERHSVSQTCLSHRLIRFSRDSDDSAAILCSHDLDASTNLLLEPGRMRSEDEWELKLEQIWQQEEVETSVKDVLRDTVWNEVQLIGRVEIDAIIEDVLRSTVLNQAQKDDMVGDIKSWSLG